MSAWITHQQANILWKMRAVVSWNDPGVMDHLDKYCHVARRLNDLVVVVVAARQHWRSCSSPENAAIGHCEIFRTIGWMLPPVRCARSGALLRFGCQSRDFPV